MMSRRDFLRLTIASAATFAAAPFAIGSPRVYGSVWLKRDDNELRLNFLNSEGVLNKQDYKAACWILRDVQANQIGIASVRLLATVAWMQAYLAQHNVHRPFLVHSGLRTPSTNKKVEGARGSMHLPDDHGLFRAMDISMDGVDSRYLGALAFHAQQGGLGFYPGRRFIHVDTGPVRYWKG
jgi:uncharacterized protein YcbK (DUF882 family)